MRKFCVLHWEEIIIKILTFADCGSREFVIITPRNCNIQIMRYDYLNLSVFLYIRLSRGQLGNNTSICSSYISPLVETFI